MNNPITTIQEKISQALENIQTILFFLFPIFFITPHDRTIGNTAEEIHFALMYAKKNNKKLVLLRRFSILNNPRIANKEIYKIQSPYILSGFLGNFLQFSGNILLSILLGHVFALINYVTINFINVMKYLLHKIVRRGDPWAYVHYRRCLFHLELGLERIWNPEFGKRNSSSFEIQAVKNQIWTKELKSPVEVCISPKKAEYCRKQLEEMGLPKNSWYVCLHNREPGYHDDKKDLRNSNIQNYFDAIQEITKRGGWVIRMGDSSMTKLPKINQIIDYPFSKYKSEVMDLFLIKNCRFFLGQNSGLVDAAYLFQKPCVLVNVTEWAIGFPRLQNSLVIFKHFYSAEAGRFLSIKELLQTSIESQDLFKFNRKNKLIDNSSEEILSVVKEFLEQKNIFQPSQLQINFKTLRNKQLESWLSGGALHNNARKDRLFKYRLASRWNTLEGTAGNTFLEQNWEKNTHRLPKYT